MPDVFISYAKADRKRVRQIVKALTAEGFDLWWDQSSSGDGQWTPQLRRALVDSAAIVACWSSESAKSSWVAAEASHAHDRKALVPVVVEQCKIPAPFNDLQSADLAKWRGDVDDPDWRRIVAKLRDLVRVKHGIGEPAHDAPSAPIPRAAPTPPAQQAAQVVSPGAFFSQNLGAPRQAATARAQPVPQPARAFEPLDPPPPPRPPPRVVVPPMDPPAPQPRPQSRPVRPVDEAPARPAARQQPPSRPVRPVDEPPAKPAARQQPPPAPRPVRPVDEPPPKPARQQQRPAPRTVQPVDEPAPPSRAPRRAERPKKTAPPPPPLRPYVPVDEPPSRRGPGVAQFALMGAVAAGIVAAILWGGERFLSAPSAPQFAQDQAAAPEPLPVEPPAPETEAVELAPEPTPEDLVPAEIETAPIEPPAAAAKQTPPRPQPAPSAAAAKQTPPRPRPEAQKQTRPAQPPPTQTARTSPAPQPASSRPPAIVLPQPSIGSSEASASAPQSSGATRDLERCLSRLVRLCSGGGSGRPGFSEDGVLSAGERALLNQRSLFAWSDAVDSNVANCTRHLNAASQATEARPYEPLAAACRRLPTSGPPR